MIVRSSLCAGVIAAVLLAGCSKGAVKAEDAIVATWVTTARSENGGPEGLPECVKDDTLTFSKEGTFDSNIAGTQCNPNEVDVIGQKFTWSEDKKSITFENPGFPYTAKVIEISKKKMTLEFDLGPGFMIRDTFVPKA